MMEVLNYKLIQILIRNFFIFFFTKEAIYKCESHRLLSVFKNFNVFLLKRKLTKIAKSLNYKNII